MIVPRKFAVVARRLHSETDFADQAFEFLAKPFRPEQLLKAVRAAISREAWSARRRDNDSSALSGAAKK